MFLVKRILSVLTFVLVASSSAYAGLIDFEGAGGSTFGQPIGSFFDVGDYRFTISDGNEAGFIAVSSQNNIVEPGTTKLFAANQAQVTMTLIGGGVFDLLSLDIGGSFVDVPDRWASSVDIVGGPLVNVAIPNSPVYQNVILNYLGVSSVVFTPLINVGEGVNDYEFVIDNILVGSASVSEPTTFILLGLSLTGLMLARRQRRTA